MRGQAPDVDVGQLTCFRDIRYDPRSQRLVETPIEEYHSLRSCAPPALQIRSGSDTGSAGTKMHPIRSDLDSDVGATGAAFAWSRTHPGCPLHDWNLSVHMLVPAGGAMTSASRRSYDQ